METRNKLAIAGVTLAAVIGGGAFVAATIPTLAGTARLTSDFNPGATEDGNGGLHQRNGITEEELTGSIADQVEEAVLAEYPDATIERLETDADGDVYEAHIIQADGTRATVKLDESFTITGTETGHGGGRDDDGDRFGSDDGDRFGSDDGSTAS